MSKIFSQLSNRRSKPATDNAQLELMFDTPTSQSPGEATGPAGPVQPDLVIQNQLEEQPLIDSIESQNPDIDNPALPLQPDEQASDAAQTPSASAAPDPDPETSEKLPETDSPDASSDSQHQAPEAGTLPLPHDKAAESKPEQSPPKPKRDTFSAKTRRREEELNQQIEDLRKEKENLFEQLEETRKNLEASTGDRKSAESKLHLKSIRTTQRAAVAPLRAPLRTMPAAPAGQAQPPNSPTPAIQHAIPVSKHDPQKRHLSVGHPESFAETGRFPPLAIIGIATIIGVVLIGTIAIIPLMKPLTPPAKADSAALPTQSTAKPVSKPGDLPPSSAPTTKPQLSALPATNNTMIAKPPIPAVQITNNPTLRPNLQPVAAQKPQPLPPPPPAWTGIARQGVSVTTNANELLLVFADTVFRKHADLSDDGRKLLLEVAEDCARHATEFQFIIQGHADPGKISSGAFQDNRELAQARADAVLALWREHGKIPAISLKAISKGEDDPPFPNTTPEMRRRNRTVTIRIVR